MNTATLDSIIKTWRREHSAQAKEMFHAAGKILLRDLARKLGVDTFEVRSSLGGPAVPGEVILHTPSLYIQVCPSSAKNPVLFRTCNGMKDYCGGDNHFGGVEVLDNITLLKRLVRNYNMQN